MAKLSINSYLGDDKLIDLINNAGGGGNFSFIDNLLKDVDAVYEVYTIGIGDSFDIQDTSDLSADVNKVFEKLRTGPSSSFDAVLIILQNPSFSNTITIPTDLAISRLIFYAIEPHAHQITFNNNESVIDNNNTNTKTIFKNLTISVSGTGRITENDELMAEVIFDNCVINYNGNELDINHQGTLTLRNGSVLNYNKGSANMSRNGGPFNLYNSSFIANNLTADVTFTDNTNMIGSTIKLRGSSAETTLSSMYGTGRIIKNNVFDINLSAGYVFYISDIVSDGECCFNIIKVHGADSKTSVTLTSEASYDNALVDLNTLMVYTS